MSIFLSSLIRVQRETLGRTHLLLSLKEEYKIHSMYFYRNLKYPSKCILDDMEYCIFSLSRYFIKNIIRIWSKRLPIVLNLEK